jgi:hypothetical protein
MKKEKQISEIKKMLHKYFDGETLEGRHIGGYPSVEDVLSLFDRTDEEIISYEVHF